MSPSSGQGKTVELGIIEKFLERGVALNSDPAMLEIHLPGRAEHFFKLILLL